MATASSCRRRAWFRSPACCARCSSTYRRGARLKVPPIPPSAPRDNAATSRSSEPSSSEKLSGVAARSRARLARALLAGFGALAGPQYTGRDQAILARRRADTPETYSLQLGAGDLRVDSQVLGAAGLTGGA